MFRLSNIVRKLEDTTIAVSKFTANRIVKPVVKQTTQTSKSLAHKAAQATAKGLHFTANKLQA